MHTTHTHTQLRPAQIRRAGCDVTTRIGTRYHHRSSIGIGGIGKFWYRSKSSMFCIFACARDEVSVSTSWSRDGLKTWF